MTERATIRQISRTRALVMLTILFAVFPRLDRVQAEGTSPPASAGQAAPDPGNSYAGMTMERFLDRLMQAESGGNDHARNSRSTALGPYQFIASTWLSVIHRHFADEAAGLSAAQTLDLRTDRQLARRAAEAYTKDNAAYLAANGHVPTFPSLRLAFLIGPGGAARLLSAPGETLVAGLLGPGVLAANPFMTNLTAADLIERAARDLRLSAKSTVALVLGPAHQFAAQFVGPSRPELSGALLVPVARVAWPLIAAFLTNDDTRATLIKAGDAATPKFTRPKIEVDCDLARPSCRRWLALAGRKLRRTARRAATTTE